MHPSSRIRAALQHPQALRWTVVLAVLLGLPCLAAGWSPVDHVQRAMVHAWETFPSLLRSPDELYAFIREDWVWQAWWRERGTLPWYTASDLQVAFFRPLASLTVYLDHRAPWSCSVSAHLHSLGWYAMCLWLVGKLFHRVLGPGWVAALAALLFAVDEAHGWSLCSVAERSTLMGMVFGTGALLAHVRWRRMHTPSAGLAAPAFLVLAFLSGEMALSILGYILAFAVFLDQGSPLGRARSIVPSLAVCAAWRVVYGIGGYGVDGSGSHVDPGLEPLRFAGATLERMPLLLQAQLTFIPAWITPSLDRPAAIGSMVAAVVLAGLALGVALRALRHDPRAWFFATGMVLSLVPAAATVPHDRLLLPAGLGGAGLVALLLASVKVRARSGKAPRSARVLAGVWLVCHLAVAPLLLPAIAVAGNRIGNSLDAVARSPALDAGKDRTLVFVTGPNHRVTWIPLYLHDNGRPVPSRVRVLAPTANPVVAHRLDEHTLELACPSGVLASPADLLAWNPTDPFRVGQVRSRSDLIARVGRVTEDGRPRRVRFEFAEPLEDLDYAWVYWTGQGYEAFALPAVGHQVRVEVATGFR